MASTFSAEFSAFIAAATQAHQVKSPYALSVYLIYNLWQMQNTNDADNDNFDDGFGINNLYDRVGNGELSEVEVGDLELGDVEGTVSQVEHRW